MNIAMAWNIATDFATRPMVVFESEANLTK